MEIEDLKAEIEVLKEKIADTNARISKIQEEVIRFVGCIRYL